MTGVLMIKNKLFIILIFTTLFTSSIFANIKVASVKFNYEYDSKDAGYAHFYFSLPYFIGLNSEFQKSIYNDLGLFEKKKDSVKVVDIEKYIYSKFEEYESSFQERLSDPMELSGFTLEKSFKITEVFHFMTVSIYENSFYGGAHPNSNINHFVYDTKNKKRLSLNDFITDLEKFKKIAETKFRNLYKVSSGLPLSSTGFQFENDTFSLPEQFYIENDAIVLFWDTYEIAPYAFGPISIKIKFKEINDLLKETILRD